MEIEDTVSALTTAARNTSRMIPPGEAAQRVVHRVLSAEVPTPTTRENSDQRPNPFKKPAEYAALFRL